MNVQTNFAGDTIVIRTWGHRLITRDDVTKTALATVPALLAASAIVIFALVRWLSAVHDADQARTALEIARAQARFDLSTRDAAIARSARAESVAQQIAAFHGTTLAALAPTVAVTNALPLSVRVKSVQASTGEIDITSAEALSYGSIMDARDRLAKRFRATITTTTFPGQQAATPILSAGAPPIANAASIQATAWGWTGSILTDAQPSDTMTGQHFHPRVQRP